MAQYSPIVNSSISAFPADTDKIKFYFEYPKMMTDSDIRGARIQYTIVNQINNISMLQTKSIEEITREEIVYENNKSFFYINKSKLKGGSWVPGTIYKVQVRFIDAIGPSEWSTICYLKATGNKSDITVKILDVENDGFAVFIDSPVFYGQYKAAAADPSELQTKYRFTLIDYLTTEIIEDTGWLSHQDIKDSYSPSQTLENFKRYYLNYSIETKNGYTETVQTNFICTLDLIEAPEIFFGENRDGHLKNNYEEGYIQVILSSDKVYSNNLLLRRTDSKSDFSIWEDYKIFNVWDEKVNIDFKDYLIEHGVTYKYSIQVISKEGYRGVSVNSNSVQANYEHMFLVGDGRQLKLKFNPKISSWKRNLQEAKIDTIGSKYPFIARNGMIDYFTFPINGLISYHVDEEELFCSKNSLCVSNQITADNAYQVNLTDDNIVLEREFRNQVEEFLTNGNYKYFKSPTEGIKLINLMGVSLQPEETLGRMIYSFSATAHEMGDSSLKSIIDLNIVDQGEYKALSDMGLKEEIFSFECYISSANQNIYSVIKNTIESNNSDDNYTKKMLYIKALEIDLINPIDTSLTILQGSEQGDRTNIIVSKNLGFYSLPDIINIYDLVGNTVNSRFNITCVAVSVYEEKEIEDSNIAENYKIVSRFAQLYNTFTQAQNNLNLFEAFKQANPALVDIYNFTFLRIETEDPNAEIELNDELIRIGETGYLERKNISIESAVMKSQSAAYISVIYNGAERP